MLPEVLSGFSMCGINTNLLSKWFQIVGESFKQAGPIVRFHLKLKALKRILPVWNKEVFGNIKQSICAAEDCVLKAEQVYDLCPSEYNKIALCSAKQTYNEKLEIDELF